MRNCNTNDVHISFVSVEKGSVIDYIKGDMKDIIGLTFIDEISFIVIFKKKYALFYIKHSEPLEIGSKLANFTALKNTVDEIIPEGYEPWSEFHPEEEISTIIASNSILKRMTPSIIITLFGNKVLIELKRKLQEIYEK